MKVAMRFMVAAVVFGALAATPAKAQNMPWCMVDDHITGSTTCAFSSFDQCQVTARGGNIGHCVRNPSPTVLMTEAVRKQRRRHY